MEEYHQNSEANNLKQRVSLMDGKDINGSLILVESLYLEGVEIIFGYPGGAVLNVYDELFKQNHFRHVLTRHEQGAVHAADGYARASGKVGVAIITSGPGFTNSVTGIATAFTDSIPLVIISGQVPLAQIGTDAFQEIDAVGISRPCTKHNYLVKDVKDLARIIKEAFYIANSGRPGPVLIDLPKDISANVCKFSYPKSINLPTYKPTIKGNLRQVKKLAKAILESKNPIAYIGGGAVISDSFDEIKEFLDITQMPSVETLMARGISQSENFLGMLGMHGTYVANMAVSECDLLISFGARFDDRVTGKVSEFAKFAKIAHIDVDPTSISKIIEVSYPIVGDLKYILKDINKELRGKSISPEVSLSRDNWNKKLTRWKEAHPLKYEDSKESDSFLKPQWVIQELGREFGENAIITTDVGQHQMWVAQFYPFSFKRQFVTSGGLGTMGFGFPANMGVYLALNSKTNDSFEKISQIENCSNEKNCDIYNVDSNNLFIKKNLDSNKYAISISGDGGILMNIQELMTCVESNINSINIILNNSYLGMVKQWQDFFYDKRHSSVKLTQPDFVRLAESFGALGFDVKSKQEFKDAIKKAKESQKVSLINVWIDKEEIVLPMVPGGNPIYKMILE